MIIYSSANEYKELTSINFSYPYNILKPIHCISPDIAHVIMLYLLPLIVSSQSCQKFTCGELDSPFGCISSVSSDVTLSPCASSALSICPYTDFTSNSTCVSLPSSPYNTSWPGDFCYSNSTCIAPGYCSNAKCQGELSSSVCTDAGDCAPGNRCVSGTCKVQLYIGFNDGSFTMNCTSDYDCVNDAACESGNCFRYFSRSEGEFVENCTFGVNWLCESGMCYDQICVSPLVQSLNPAPFICKSDDDCVSDYYLDGPDPFSLNSSCQCGFNGNGYSYCTLFPGDLLQTKYRSILIEWIDSDEIFNCHSYSRFKLDCIKLYWTKEKYLEYAYYFLYTTMYPQITNNPLCVQQLITYQFYQAAQEYKNSLGLWIITTITLFYII